MFKKLSHVGVAVKDLGNAEQLFAKLTGAHSAGSEEVSEQRVKLSFFHIGDFSMELTQATASDSPIAKYIEKRGEGIHHLSFEVDDIRAELARLKTEGFSGQPRYPRRSHQTGEGRQAVDAAGSCQAARRGPIHSAQLGKQPYRPSG